MEKKVKLSFNWAGILAFVVFWTYSLYGSPLALGKSSLDKILFILSFVVTTAIFCLFVFLLMNRKLNAIYKDRLEIRAKDFLVLLSYVAIILVFSFRELRLSLAGDENCHVLVSQLYFQRTAYRLGIIFEEYIGRIPFKMVLWGLDTIGLIGVFIVLQCLRRISWSKAIALVTIFATVKIGVAFLWIGNSTHPAFRLFPLWLFGSLFSSSAFVYRLPHFLALVVFMWFVQRELAKRVPVLQSWLFGLVAGTIPVLWHTGLIIEPSIWTACSWSIMLLVVGCCFGGDEAQAPIFWVRWFSLISIFCLMRQTAFLALVPLGLLFLRWLYENRTDIKLQDILLIVSPVVVMAVFIIKIIIKGTGASYRPGEVDYISIQASALHRVLFSLTSGIGPKVILNSVMIPWVVCFFFAFLPCKKEEVLKRALIFTLFAGAYFMFYSIRPVLWGVGRYQAEYIIPFAILGAANIVLLINRSVIYSKIVSPILLSCLLCFNIFSFIRLPKYNASADERQKIVNRLHSTVVLSQDFYNYAEALTAVKQSGYADRVYIVDDYNAIFNTIIYGFSIREFAEWKRIRTSITCFVQDEDLPVQLTENPDIGIVLIGRYDWDAPGLIQRLKELGWKGWKNFRNERYGSTIYGLIRTEEESSSPHT